MNTAPLIEIPAPAVDAEYALATLVYPQDLYPFVIVGQSPGRTQIEVCGIRTPARMEPTRMNGPWAVYDVRFDWDEGLPIRIDWSDRRVAHWSEKHQEYRVRSTARLDLGVAHYYRDFSW